MWAIGGAMPVHSEILKADVVEVNTNEAKKLFEDKAVVIRTWTIAGRRAQAYWYGGKNYLWVAGVTSRSADDDYPVSQEEIEKRDAADSQSPA